MLSRVVKVTSCVYCIWLLDTKCSLRHAYEQVWFILNGKGNYVDYPSLIGQVLMLPCRNEYVHVLGLGSNRKLNGKLA